MDTNLEWAEFYASRQGHFHAEGVVLLRDGEPIGLMVEDSAAHEGVPVAAAAQMLSWAGVKEHTETVCWNYTQYLRLLNRLRADERVVG